MGFFFCLSHHLAPTKRGSPSIKLTHTLDWMLMSPCVCGLVVTLVKQVCSSGVKTLQMQLQGRNMEALPPPSNELFRGRMCSEWSWWEDVLSCINLCPFALKPCGRRKSSLARSTPTGRQTCHKRQSPVWELFAASRRNGTEYSVVRLISLKQHVYEK